MARSEGSLKLSNNLEPRVSAPLDARLVVPEKNDLYALEYCYKGAVVYVVSEDNYYRLINDLTTQETSWKKWATESEYIEVTVEEAEAWFN